MASKTTILFLSADPSEESRLRLGQEIRDIRERFRLSSERDAFEIEERHCLRLADFTQAVFDVRPNVIHFSGHGAGPGGLCFETIGGETHLVETEALRKLFGLFAKTVEGVILNACSSSEQAQAIAESIADVVGMRGTISDEGAIAFSVGFYKALAASSAFHEAYRAGVAELHGASPGEQDLPQLFHTDLQPPAMSTLPSSGQGGAAQSEPIDRQVYRSLITRVSQKVHLDAWENWTHRMFSLKLSWRPEQLDAVNDVTRWIAVSDWPGTLPELETAIVRFGYLLQQSLASFLRRAEYRPELDDFYAVRYYKTNGFNPNYHKDMAEFDCWVASYESMLAEATQAANWIRQIWRADGNADFLPSGLVHFVVGPDINWQDHIYSPAYSDSEKRALIEAGRDSTASVPVVAWV